jgi:hypothetical protein
MNAIIHAVSYSSFPMKWGKLPVAKYEAKERRIASAGLICADKSVTLF